MVRDLDFDANSAGGAIIFGGIAACAITLLLLAVGVGIGFSAVSPWSDQGCRRLRSRLVRAFISSSLP